MTAENVDDWPRHESQLRWEEERNMSEGVLDISKETQTYRNDGSHVHNSRRHAASQSLHTCTIESSLRTSKLKTKKCVDILEQHVRENNRGMSSGALQLQALKRGKSSLMSAPSAFVRLHEGPTRA